MARVTAVDGDAEMAWRRAQVFLAVPASRAGSATDPWKDRDPAPPCDRGVGAGFLHHAGDLVAEREGQRAAGTDIELLVAAELEIAVVDMQVGMAHAAALDSDQDFAPPRLRAIDDRLAQRCAIGHERLAKQLGHDSSPVPMPSWARPDAASSALASATKPATGT